MDSLKGGIHGRGRGAILAKCGASPQPGLSGPGSGVVRGPTLLAGGHRHSIPIVGGERDALPPRSPVALIDRWNSRMSRGEFGRPPTSCVMFPRQPDPVLVRHAGERAEWRGIPLAVPVHLDPGPARVDILKCWREDGMVMLKLVHPGLGTTTDYSLQRLFDASAGLRRGSALRNFALLRMAPGWPEPAIPDRIIVERLGRFILEMLSDEGLHAQCRVPR